MAGCAAYHGSAERRMIRTCTDADLAALLAVINDAAQAYRGVIPPDRWHEPYMPLEALRRELAEGVSIVGCEEQGELVGVMGIQDKGEVDLIRHAYVRTRRRRDGIGTALLRHLEASTAKPILIGTWADAVWAIRFYEKNGYRVLAKESAASALARYWSVPAAQAEASVVLAHARCAPDTPVGA